LSLFATFLFVFSLHQGVPQTKFSERIFGVLDMDGSGALDFFEFAVGVRLNLFFFPFIHFHTSSTT